MRVSKRSSLFCRRGQLPRQLPNPLVFGVLIQESIVDHFNQRVSGGSLLASPCFLPPRRIRTGTGTDTDTRLWSAQQAFCDVVQQEAGTSAIGRSLLATAVDLEERRCQRTHTGKECGIVRASEDEDVELVLSMPA